MKQEPIRDRNQIGDQIWTPMKQEADQEDSIGTDQIWTPIKLVGGIRRADQDAHKLSCCSIRMRLSIRCIAKDLYGSRAVGSGVSRREILGSGFWVSRISFCVFGISLRTLHVLVLHRTSFSVRSRHRSRAINRSSATTVLRSLLPISVAILLGWVLAGMIATRLSYLQGPTVVGQYDREPIVGASRRGPRWHGFVRYHVPDDWPVAAGQLQRYEVGLTSSTDGDRAVGSDTQLKLSRATPDDAMEWSFTGFWALPIAVGFFGCAVLLCCAAVVPAPAGGSRRAEWRFKSSTGSRPNPRTARIGAGIALAVFASFFVYPRGMLLVLPPLFFAITALGVIESPYRMVLRLVSAPGSGFGGNDPRPGMTGLVVDLLQQASLAIVLAGFCAISILAFTRGLEGLVSTGGWSSGAFNTLRTLPWLPQDFDQALCDAADRQDAAATTWLVEHGARPRVVCAAGTPPVTPAMRFDHPALPPSQIELDALLYAAVESAESDPELARYLLARGASPNAEREGRPVLLAAAWNTNDHAVKRLLDAGADPNRPTSNGNTVLTEIVGLDRPDKAQEYLPWLIARGGDLNHRGEARRSVLLQRCVDFRTTDLEFLEGLMNLGADPNLEDASGRTALDYLYEQRADEAIGVFEAHGARRATARRGGR
jgi:hypothetical protein